MTLAANRNQKQVKTTKGTAEDIPSLRRCPTVRNSTRLRLMASPF